MSANSKIEWCDHTFNPWIGCAKVSPGCAHCYAEQLMDRRYGKVQWGKGKERHRTGRSYWKQPIKWNLEARKSGKRFRVFCGSLCDWLDDEVPIEWLADLLALIHATPNLDWLLLTKRPQNFSARLSQVEEFECRDDEFPSLAFFLSDWRFVKEIPQNVWFGVSVEDQKRADERIPSLLEIPAKIRFLSCEPLLEAINLLGVYDRRSPANHIAFSPLEKGALVPQHVDWVICGGESGSQARRCDMEWIRDIALQCRRAGVAAFVKQLGSNLSDRDLSECRRLSGVSMKHRKGGDISEWPEDLRVREFPTA